MISAAVAKATAKPAASRRLDKSDVDVPRYKATARIPIITPSSSASSAIPTSPKPSSPSTTPRPCALHLAALGFPQRNIVSLIGPKATKTGLIKELETWLPRNVGPNSTVFVYYSGHGAPDVKSGRSYLVPWDGDPLFLDDTAYPVDRLYQKLGELKAKRVIVALDSCFSGLGGRTPCWRKACASAGESSSLGAARRKSGLVDRDGRESGRRRRDEPGPRPLHVLPAPRAQRRRGGQGRPRHGRVPVRVARRARSGRGAQGRRRPGAAAPAGLGRFGASGPSARDDFGPRPGAPRSWA